MHAQPEIEPHARIMEPRRRARPAVARWTWTWLAFMASIHVWQAASVSDEFSATYDELPHLTAGVFYWREGDFRFQPENGILPQRWAALALLGPEWRLPAADAPVRVNADVWRAGDEFLHRPGHDLRQLLRRGRTMIALLGGLLVLAIGRWAWELGGPGAAWVAGPLAAFSPTLLAHAGLVTSDTAAALGFVAATAAWWRVLHAVTPARVLAAGLTAGALVMTKYSGLLFPFIALALLGVRWARPAALPVGAGTWKRRWRGPVRLVAWAAAALAGTVVAAATIWAAYGFRYTAAGAQAPADHLFFRSWEQVLMEQPATAAGIVLADGTMIDTPVPLDPGPVQAFVRLARDRRLLPEAWLYGLAFMEGHSRFRPAFFNGEWRATGWWEFFPAAYLMKSTPAELLLHAATLALWIGLAAGSAAGRRRWPHRLAPLLVLGAVYGGFALTSALNIGHRHILPMYACGAVLAGGAAGVLLRRPRPAVTAGFALALTAQVATAALTRPDYLAYFNVLAGGREQAHRHFVDSSLDWGQDLWRLADWQQRHAPGEPLFLSYFGSAAPERHGVRAVRTGDHYADLREDRPPLPEWRAGWYVISATQFQRVNSAVRGPWTPGFERRYRQLLAWATTLHAARPGEVVNGPDGSPLTEGEYRDLLLQLDQLRFGRLCRHLQARQPDARIGATLFAFRLGDEELAAALFGPVDIFGVLPRRR